MDVYCMPLEPAAFDRPFTDPRRASSYGARWATVVKDLEDEASRLGADEVVIALALDRAALRLDGFPKADAKVPDHVAIYLPRSDHGPLRFLSDRWWGWQDNVRAVGLTLQRLRLVAEAGVAQGGEQYRGWQALPPGRPGLNGLSREAAADILVKAAGLDANFPTLTRGEAIAAYREAVKRHHPDVGGDPDLFRQITAAKEVLVGG